MLAVTLKLKSSAVPCNSSAELNAVMPQASESVSHNYI